MSTLQQTGLSFAPIIHLTDLHLTVSGELLPGGVDPWMRLDAALDLATQRGAAAVVVTGDIGDRRSSHPLEHELEVYERASQVFANFTEETEAPVIVTPGNHDREGSVKELNPAAHQHGPTPGDTVTDVSGLRIIGLNTHGFGEEAGRLIKEQVDWLAEELRAPSPAGTILAMHHPPFTSMISGIAGRGLVFPGRLEQAIEGTDVQLILCGHYHSSEMSALGSTPVWSGPSLSFNNSILAEPGFIEETTAGGLSIIHPTRVAVTPVELFRGELFRRSSDGTLDGYVMHAKAGT